MNKINYIELSSKIVCFGLVGAAVFIALKYMLGYLVPFIIAWGVAYIVYPIAKGVAYKTKISRKACSFILVLSFVITILSLVFLVGNRLLYEIQNLMYALNNNGDEIASYVQRFFDFFNSIGERLPVLNKLKNTELSNLIKENANKFVSNIWESLLTTLSSAVPNLAKNIVFSLPEVLLTGLITIISCFYFSD